MTKKRILEKITSKYILRKVTDYIKDNNFVYKIFLYSKSFQEKLNLGIVNYQALYFQKNGLNIEKYELCEDNLTIDAFDKNILTNNYKEDLEKFNIDKKNLEKIISCIIEINGQKIKKKKDEDLIFLAQKKIEIYSPIFDIISGGDISEYNYTIYIPINIIAELNLKNDYISFFEKINQSNLYCSSFEISFRNIDIINYLEEFKINLNKIKRLTFSEDYNDKSYKDYDIFLGNLFSIESFINNLIDLKLYFFNKCEHKIYLNVMNNLNNFKSLKILHLRGFEFENNFILNLTTLIELSLENCINIVLNDNLCLNLKNLYLEDCNFPMSNTLLKFPKLEICDFFNIDEQRYSSIIDFQSLDKIKSFSGEVSDFLYLNNIILEEVTLFSLVDNSYESELKLFEKIISLKNLKKISFELYYLDIDDIINIKGQNNSLLNLELNWNQDNKCILNDIIDKFPNLKSIKLVTQTNVITAFNNFERNRKTNLNIIEHPLCEIDKISLKIKSYAGSINLYCKPFDHLIEVKLNIESEINNIQNTFPIFKNKCNLIFTSLTLFHLKINCQKNKSISNILEILYNNIDCMPNLKDFSIHIIKPDQIDFSKIFIGKMLSKNLDHFHFIIKDLYDDKVPLSKKEIKKLWPSINFSKFKDLFIQKLKTSY